MSAENDVVKSDSRPASDRLFYDAFVSYATSPDRDLVRDIVDYIEGLHSDPLMAEKFRVPLKLCLDGRNFIFPKAKREEGTKGEETIRTVVCDYQADSRCLIVFSGEESLTHPWINKEIEWWCERYGVEKVYFSLTHGDVLLDEQRRPILKAMMPAELVKRGGAANDVWFDLRGFHEQRRRSLLSLSGRPQRRASRPSAGERLGIRVYGEERIRLATVILSEKLGLPLRPNDLIPAWRAAERVKRRRVRRRNAIAIVCVAMAAIIAWIFEYRLAQSDQVTALTSEAQAAIDDQQFERAIKISLLGLPVPGQPPWALRWSDPSIRALEAKLEGAAQLSAMTHRFEEERAVDQANLPYAAFNPEATKIVTAGENARATIWDIATGKRIAECNEDLLADKGDRRRHANPDWLWSSQFSPDGRWVVSGNQDGVAMVWRASGDPCKGHLLLPAHRGAVRGAAFSHDSAGKFVVTASEDGTTRLWDAATAMPLQPPRQWDHGKLTSVDFSPIGNFIVVGSAEGYVAIANVEQNEQAKVLQESGAQVWSVKFSPDGMRVVASSNDGTVVIFDVESGARLGWLPKHRRSVNSAAYSPDGERIVTASTDATVRIWDVKNLYNISELFLLKGHSQRQSVRHAEFSPDGLSVVSASSDRTLRIWDAATNAKPQIIRAHATKPLRSIEFAREGRQFVTVASDGTAQAWTFGPTGMPNLQAEFPSDKAGGVASATFASMNDKVVVSTKSGDLLIWDPSTNTFPWHSASALEDDVGIGQIAPGSGDIVVARGTKELGPEIWNIRTGTHWPLKGPLTVDTQSVELSRDAKLVLSVSSGAVAQLWDAKTGELLTSLKDTAVTSAHFSPDGQSAVTTSLNRTLRVWDVRSGEELLQLRGHETDVNGARFSFDGTRIVSASSDLSVRVWDRQTGAQIVRFAVKDDAMDATFNRDGNSVIAALHDGTAEVFDVRWTMEHGDNLVSRVCALKLPNARSLTFDDGLVPLLSRYVGMDPCDRTGVFLLILNFLQRTANQIPEMSVARFSCANQHRTWLVGEEFGQSPQCKAADVRADLAGDSPVNFLGTPIQSRSHAAYFEAD